MTRPRRTPVRRLAALLGLLVVALLAVAPSASGHAYLLASEPFRDEIFRSGQPERVVFKFNEPVEAQFGAVRVFDVNAERVDQMKLYRPEGNEKQLAVDLEPGLPDGSYTATYRLISYDGHVITGGMLFHVGERSPDGALSVAAVIGGDGGGPWIDTAFAAVRALDYVAIALALGGIAFLLLCWLPGLRSAAGGDARWREASEAYGKRAGLLLLAAVNLGLATTALGILIQGAIVSGQSFWAALEANVVREVLDTRFGTVWGIKLLVWLSIGAVLLAVPRTVPVLRPVSLGADGHVLARPGPMRTVALVLPVAALALFPALSGHASTTEPTLLLAPLDVAHVAAMSLWIGGLVALLALVPAATKRLEPAERAKLLAAVLVRFSPLALLSVAVLAVTGTIASIEYLDSFGDLTGTGFGRAILIKAGLLVVLIGLGALNRQRTLPKLRAIAADGEGPGGAGRVLRNTLRAEVALIAVVLSTTGALVGLSPPAASAERGGPVNIEQQIGPLDITASVTPGRLGNNAIHLYLFNRKDGTPFTETKSITAQTTLKKANVGPLDIAVRESGPGHYTADAFQFTLAGTWQIEVVVRVGEFDEYTTTLDVPFE